MIIVNWSSHSFPLLVSEKRNTFNQREHQLFSDTSGCEERGVVDGIDVMVESSLSPREERVDFLRWQAGYSSLLFN